MLSPSFLQARNTACTTHTMSTFMLPLPSSCSGPNLSLACSMTWVKVPLCPFCFSVSHSPEPWWSLTSLPLTYVDPAHQFPSQSHTQFCVRPQAYPLPAPHPPLCICSPALATLREDLTAAVPDGGVTAPVKRRTSSPMMLGTQVQVPPAQGRVAPLRFCTLHLSPHSADDHISPPLPR